MASAALVYAAVTALLFRSLLPGLTTHLYSHLGDPLLNAAILAWNAKQLPLSDAWWNFPAFAPLAGVTAFTEHLLLAYPVASPIIWATGNPILAANVVFLAAPILNGVAAYALARELTNSPAGAFIAGLAFAFAPYQATQLSHIQTMTACGMPVALLGLHQYLRPPAAAPGPRRRGLGLFATGWFVTALSNAYMLAFFPVLVVLWCAWFVRPAEWRRLIAIGGAAVAALIPLVPLLWGYQVRHAAYGLAREYNEIKSFAADMVGLGGMYYRTVAWRGILPHDFEEGALFPGVTILGLAILGVVGSRAVKARPMVDDVRVLSKASDLGARRAGLYGPPSRWSRRLLVTSGLLTLIVLARIWTGYWGWHIGPVPLPPFQPMLLFTLAFVLCLAGMVMTPAFQSAWHGRDAAMFYATAVVVLWLLALGPEPAWSTPWRGLWFGPYWLLMQLPGFDSLRVPARMWLPAVLCLAVLAGFGAAALLGRYARYRRALVPACAAAIVIEGWCADAVVAAPRPMPEGLIPAGAIVLDLPIEEGFWNAIPEYRAVLGGYRTVNGYSGYEPAHFTPLRHAIADMVPHTLDGYRRAADLYLIVRPGQDPNVTRWLTSQPGTEHLFDVDQARIYRMMRLQE
jgi:hypothetical protein